MENKSDIPLREALVGIVYNLKREPQEAEKAPDMQAEYDSFDTVLSISEVIKSHGYKTVLIEADEQLPGKLLDTRPDIVFNIAEGKRGRAREAEVPAILTLLDIPFTGSDETTLCIALDKALTKRFLSTYHIRSPKSIVIKPDEPVRAAALKYPVIIKPNAEGSSKGISEICIAESAAELKKLASENAALYGEAMLAEEYIEGREFTVGILGNGDKTHVFPPMEIAFHGRPQGKYRVYSFQVKQDYEKYVSYHCPADITPALDEKMRKIAKKIYEVLGCRDFSRVDFRVNEAGEPYFIEINPLPGLAPHYSDFPMLAEFSGMPYDELVMGVLQAGAKRCGVKL